jgi:micrococcal nuclease
MFTPRLTGTLIAAILVVLAIATQPVLAQVVDQYGTVVAVIDGDTVDVVIVDGTRYRVRYIGIDTPETRAPRVGVQCWGAEASARNRELVLGQVV